MHGFRSYFLIKNGIKIINIQYGDICIMKKEILSAYCPLTKTEAKQVTKLFTRYYSLYMQYAWWLSGQIMDGNIEDTVFLYTSTDHYGLLYQDLIKANKKDPTTQYYGLLGESVRENMNFLYRLFYKHQKEIIHKLYDMDFKSIRNHTKDQTEFVRYISAVLRKYTITMQRNAFSFPVRNGLKHVAKQVTRTGTITIPGIKLTVPIQTKNGFYYDRRPNCVYYTLYHNRHYKNRVALYVKFQYKDDGFIYLKPCEGSSIYHGAF